MTANLGRFTVREANIWDAGDILDLLGSEETVRYMGVRQLKSMEEAASLLQRYEASPSKWLSVHDGKEFMGIVGVELRGHQATLTIAFKRTGKARGAGREFSVPFVKWIFTHPQIWRVWAYCHVDNIPVQRVLERMHARFEGRLCRFEFFPNLSTEPQDVLVYAITR